MTSSSSARFWLYSCVRTAKSLEPASCSNSEVVMGSPPTTATAEESTGLGARFSGVAARAAPEPAVSVATRARGPRVFTVGMVVVSLLPGPSGPGPPRIPQAAGLGKASPAKLTTLVSSMFHCS